MRLVSLGDLILDVVVQLDAPLVSGDDRTATTRVCAGGQAANVAAWARSLGAGSRFVGKRGADAGGELALRELTGAGVEVVGPAEGRNGVVVSIVTGGERSMASDRGSAPELRADELIPAWFECDALHISGYALLLEPVATAAMRAARLARSHGAQVSVDLSSWTLIDDPFRTRVRDLAPEIVFATAREHDEFGPLPARWIVKRGAEGVTVEGVDHPALPTDVIDPTGAGDAFAAGYLVAGVTAGLAAAARCCTKLGAMP